MSALAGVKSFGSRYAVGLVAALLVLPGACSTAVVAWKLVGGGSTSAVLYGTIIGVGTWGLAGVAGVVLTAYVIDLNDGGEVPKLADIFNVTENPLGLVTAAVFGFTPTLVGTALQKGADEAKKQLKASAPGEESE
jgi:hypothetical protein